MILTCLFFEQASNAQSPGIFLWWFSLRGVDLPTIISTKQFILNIQEELKQWFHENQFLFIQENRKQDKALIGYEEEYNNMFYEFLFEFETILGNPINTSSIL